MIIIGAPISEVIAFKGNAPPKIGKRAIKLQIKVSMAPASIQKAAKYDGRGWIIYCGKDEELLALQMQWDHTMPL